MADHRPRFEVEFIIELVRTGPRRVLLPGAGARVKLRDSNRLRMFALKGTTCVTCGIEATHFELETSPGAGTPHLNLYSGGILMTRDHIKPRSRSGASDMANLQPMCTNCNHAKADFWEEPVAAAA